MGDKREYLTPGKLLYFENGVRIEIEEVVGGGGTALTYYGKELMEEQEPVRVLLKELYPCSVDFSRGADGRIVGEDPEAECVYDALTEALYCEQELGNQIAQKKIVGLYPMKQVLKEQNTGNYYGLFYQCPPSITLRSLVEKAGDHMSFWGKLKLIWALCRLVRTVHEQGGYCHNDISGGNVIIMSNALLQEEYVDWNSVERELQVGLIDFACAAKLNRRGEAELPDIDEPMQFHTDGFSAPELYEMGNRDVTVKADVYSVTACLWYLLTGKVLETENGYPVLGQQEWRFLERCLRRHEFCSLSGDVRVEFEKNPNPIPEDVIDKIEHLLEHGLAESWNRFRSMEILEDRLQEIIDLAEGSSVSEEVLEKRLQEAFRTSRKKLRNRYEIREALLPVAVKVGEKETDALLDIFLSGESAYAIGPGGVGKTTTMFHAAERLYHGYGDMIPVYMELNRLPMWNSEADTDPQTYWMGKDERPMFLEQYLAGIYYGCHGKLTGRNDLVAGALRRQVERRNPNGKKYLILMDGLNEMAFSDHEEKQAFTSAINWYLTYGANIALILTSRYDEGLIDSEDIQRVQVKGLTEEAVAVCLKEEVAQGHITNAEYDKLMSTDRKSNLWKCLKLPLFFAMYCRIEDKRKLQSAGEILQAYFRGKGRALDGSQEYSEAAIGEEKYLGLQFADGLSVENARRLIIDLLLPRLGYSMMYLQVFFLEKNAAENMMSRYLSETCMASVAKRYGYTFDVEQALQIMKKAGAEKILNYVCENMGILVQESGGSYFFPHQYYRDYFAANHIIRMFCELSEVWEKPEKRYEDYDLMEDLIEYFAARMIPESILMLCGECLGIHRTVPEYGANGWYIPESWDPLVDSMLDLCRLINKKDGEFSEHQEFETQVRLEQMKPKALYLESHIFHMLCLCRRRGKRADLSGIDFSGISLNMCPIENVIFSHPHDQKGIYADLRDTGYRTKRRKIVNRRTREMDPFSFFGEDIHHEVEKQRLYEEKQRAVMHPEGSWLLVMDEREGFMSWSHTNEFQTHLEEREVLGDEIRPLGYWDKVEAVRYRDDGRFLAIVETVTNVDTYMLLESRCFEKMDMNEVGVIRNVYFYDRKEGKTYWSKMNPTPPDGFTELSLCQVIGCKWFDDIVVILQTTKENRLVHTVVRLEDGQLSQTHTTMEMTMDMVASLNSRYYILDQERILIDYFAHGVIYHIHTGETVWFEIKTECRYYVPGSNKKCIYAFFRNGVVERITWAGERSVIRESGLFAEIEQLKIYKENLFFVAKGNLYQTDETFRDIRFIRQLSNTNVRLLSDGELSIGGNLAAIDASEVFRISDGMVVKRWDHRDEMSSLPLRIWVHPKAEAVRVSVLDQRNKVLYQLGLKEERSLTCIGYCFVELNDEPVHAIYVDSTQKRLLTCEDKQVCYYDLNSGEKLEAVSTFDLQPYSIVEAAFAPGGNCLEVNAMHYRTKEMQMFKETHLLQVDYQNGTCHEHSQSDSQGEVIRYGFLPEDIKAGMDSGRRKTVLKRTSEWYDTKQKLEEDWRKRYHEEDIYKSITWSDCFKEIVDRFKKYSIELSLFGHGSNYCGIDKDGYFYWDDSRKCFYRMEGIIGIRDEFEYMDYYHQNTYPFEDGFIEVDVGQLTWHVENHRLKTMDKKRWWLSSADFALGCPGTES